MDTVQPSSNPAGPSTTMNMNMEKAPLETPSASAAAAAAAQPAQDVERGEGEKYSDRVLLGHRSHAETIVLCFANLIPPLGVALSTRDCSKVTVAILLTCCFYLPGLIYAFACISSRGTGRWADSPCTLGL